MDQINWRPPHWYCCFQECGEHEFCKGCEGAEARLKSIETPSVDYGPWIKILNPDSGTMLHIRKDYVLGWQWDGNNLDVTYLGVASDILYEGDVAKALHKAFLASGM